MLVEKINIIWYNLRSFLERNIVNIIIKYERNSDTIMFGRRKLDEGKIFMQAKEFAKEFSDEINVFEMIEYIGSPEKGYPCLELHFPKNNELRDKLLASGHCTLLDSYTEDGKRIQGVLLWFDKKGKDIINKVPKSLGYPTSAK